MSMPSLKRGEFWNQKKELTHLTLGHVVYMSLRMAHHNSNIKGLIFEREVRICVLPILTIIQGTER